MLAIPSNDLLIYTVECVRESTRRRAIIDYLVRVRRHEQSDRDVDDGVTRRTKADRRHRRLDHHDAGSRSAARRRPGTERRRRAWRPTSATAQRAAVDDSRGRGGSRRRRCRRIPGDVQVCRSVRRHEDETLLDVHHQSEGGSCP